MNLRYSMICALIVSGLLSTAYNKAVAQNVAQRDSLSRELILEREYIPSAEKVHKLYFNPLENKSSVRLTPLKFVRNDYNVALSVRPTLFDPLYIDHAPQPSAKTWYLRLYGGYPGYVGGSTGWHINATETDALDLLLEHQSERVNLRTTAQHKEVREIKIHDTQATIRYTHPLQNSFVHLTAQAYYDLGDVYGLAPTESTASNTSMSYPLLGLKGGRVYIDKTSSSVEESSPWRYSLQGGLGYTLKDDLHHDQGEISLPSYSKDPMDLTNPVSTSQLFLSAMGEVSYNVSDLWHTGLKLHGQYGVMPTLKAYVSGSGPYVLGVAPYFDFTYHAIEGHLGAMAQLLNRGNHSVLVVPDVQVSWKAFPILTFRLQADGGGELYDLRETYKLNRYVQSTSLFYAMDVTSLRVSIGADLGNVRGFSIGVKGGLQKYEQLCDWKTHYLVTSSDMGASPLTYFSLRPKQNINRAFVELHTLFISPYGFSMGGELALDHYKYIGAAMEDALKEEVYGLPSLQLHAFVDYQITPSLHLRGDFSGLGGTLFESANASEKISAKWTSDLNIGADYKLNDKVTISLQGLNLLGQPNARWLYYDRPGIGIIGAVSVHL